MRQAGYLAAAGIYALENNINRLAEDHDHAWQIGAALLKKQFVANLMPVETNILIFDIKTPYSPVSFTEQLAKNGILAIAISATQVRMVTHLDISDAMVEELIALIETM